MNQNGNHKSGPGDVVGVISARGGGGQSTVCLEWARALGHSGRRCLLLEVAGGDLAALAGTAPMKFTEDVAESETEPVDAVSGIAPGADLLASGTSWSVFGPPNDAVQERLAEQLLNGPWTDWVIDLGRTRPHRHHPLWRTCRTIAVVLQDDMAGVTRTYALVRHLLACGWGDRMGLVFNRVSDGGQVERLRRHFDQVTKAFLQFTLPVIGVVPEGTSERRAAAVRQWVSPARDGGNPVPGVQNRITAPVYATDTTL